LSAHALSVAPARGDADRRLSIERANGASIARPRLTTEL